jgi:hypothetical protein
MTVKIEQLLKDGNAPKYVYHDRTEWSCAVFAGKRYGSKGYPQRNAAHVWRTTNKHTNKEGNKEYSHDYN